jgi:murein DD-endopeptidase MepM/ murein hydrolase activator NlpD
MRREGPTTIARLVAMCALAAALCPGGLAFAQAADEPPPLRDLASFQRAWILPRDTSLLEPPPVHPLDGKPDYGEADARFGASRDAHAHEGQDVFAPAGTPLVAVRDGVVLETGDDGGRGNYIGIWSAEEGETYVYFHMLRPSALKPGQRVSVGERVGRLGCTGSCWGDHLHFEIRRGRSLQAPAVDPLPVLRQLQRP